MDNINNYNDDWDFESLASIDEMNYECGKKTIHKLYTTDLAVRICVAIATDTRTLEQICDSHPDFPSAVTINKWRLVHPAFGRNFNAAKKNQAQLLIDEIIDIIDDPANCEQRILMWARERVKTRQWLATKLLPRIYGELRQLENKVTMSHEESIKDLE